MNNCDLCQFNQENKLITKPINGVLNITNQCNFRCKYCFVQHNAKKIDLKTAEAACEFLLKDCGENIPNLWFFGGEPMLEFENIIKPIVLKYSEKMSFGITTNGSLLNEDAIDFFKKYNIGILLSIDGIKEVQDYQRPYCNGQGSFDDVLKNIPYLLLNFPNTIFRATLTKFSIPYMTKTYEFARHMGFKRICWVINEEEEYDEKDYNTLCAQYNHLALEIMKGSSLYIDDFDKIKEYIKNKTSNSIHRCGYGTTSVGIDVDGNILPCQELNSFSNELIIGNVFTGIDHEKHQKFIDWSNKETKIEGNFTSEEKRILKNAVCPKHQYFNNNFTLTDGRKYQILASKQVIDKWKKLGSHSNNMNYRRLSQ